MATAPLSGIRILDLTQVAIGPYATLLLAGLGAEVLKVESHRRPDTSRGVIHPTTPGQLRQYPDHVPGDDPWNRTAFFNQRNRGKLGVTLDLSQPAGKALLLRLATVCDALVENFRAAVLERQGLGWDALHAANPRLVYLKLSSQGNSGPERDYGSLGSTLEQTAGLAAVTGYPGDEPQGTNLVYPDSVGGILAVGALIAGLRRVRRGGPGHLIDFSQRELTAGLFGEALMDYALNGRIAERIGNRQAGTGPRGVYPCRPAPPERAGAPDRWVAVSATTDEQWQALRQALGDPAWAADAALTTPAGRWARHDELDERLAAWTRDQDADALMQRLQAAGVPAGVVHDGHGVLTDRQLAARGFWEWVQPTHIDRALPLQSAPWRLSGAPRTPAPAAPLLGEHNDDVYRDLLGLTAAEYDRLQADGVISTTPAW